MELIGERKLLCRALPNAAAWAATDLYEIVPAHAQLPSMHPALPSEPGSGLQGSITVPSCSVHAKLIVFSHAYVIAATTMLRMPMKTVGTRRTEWWRLLLQFATDDWLGALTHRHHEGSGAPCDDVPNKPAEVCIPAVPQRLQDLAQPQNPNLHR